MMAPDKAPRPEHLAFSRSGRLLAISNATDGAVAVYRVDADTHLVEPSCCSAMEM
jgi:hypothetical protein